MTIKNENYIKLYHTMDGGITKHILIIQYKNKLKKYESDKPFIKMVKNKDTGEEYTTLPVIHSSFNDKEDKLFYLQAMQNIKEESVDIIYTTDYPYLEVRDGKINYFNVDSIKKEINTQKINKEFPLISFYLKNMFSENYNEFINFLAFRFQNPFINPKISFVLYGSNQIGKSTFITSFLSKIFGSFNVAPNLSINKNEDFHFNAKFINKIFTCIEEFNSKDKKIVETFKNLIVSNSYDKNDKFKTEIHVPHFNTYIINTNHYPQWLEQQEKARRFIVLSLNKQLFLENSLIEDFEDEIPAFINFINDFNCKKPLYEDFEKINTLSKYTSNDNNIWANVLSEFIASRDSIQKAKDNEIYLRINSKTITTINAIYNDLQGNTGQNIVNFNIKSFISKIIDIKSDRITAFYQKPKKIDGAVWNDYIIIKTGGDETPPPVKDDKDNKDNKKITIEDITTAKKTIETKEKEIIKKELNITDSIFNNVVSALNFINKNNIDVVNETINSNDVLLIKKISKM